MQIIDSKIKNKKTILALGAESAGNFCIFHKNKIYLSKPFGDLLKDKNFSSFQKAISAELKKNEIIPNVILTDLHPDYKTTILGQKLAKKFKSKHFSIQHHLAHIFSAIGERVSFENKIIPKKIIGVACDGTGYGFDENIWGGEIFKIDLPNKKFERIGHLENQIMPGGDLSVQEPARMLIGILTKFMEKEEIYLKIKKYYSKRDFEVLYNQIDQKFNCQKTSSVGRILDAISLMLGFCKNERKSKHGPAYLLEKNSTQPYQIKPVIKDSILLTSPIFEYLEKNLKKDRKRLAATAQKYIADGLIKIIGKNQSVYFAGGISNIKIISNQFKKNKFIGNEKIPRGDAGISFGQIFFYLLTNPRN